MAGSAAEPDDVGAASSADIRALLDRLVSERQRLRLEGAAAVVLESNRRAIVHWQARLASTLAAQAQPR